MMKFRRNQKGFTLLEVMLVVLIIGIIAIIALPRLLVTRQTAAENACASNRQALKTQLEQYHWNTGGWPADLHTIITNEEYFPVNQTVSENCPLDGTPLDYAAADGSLYCDNHDARPVAP